MRNKAQTKWYKTFNAIDNMNNFCKIIHINKKHLIYTKKYSYIVIVLCWFFNDRNSLETKYKAFDIAFYFIT